MKNVHSNGFNDGTCDEKVALDSLGHYHRSFPGLSIPNQPLQESCRDALT